MSKLKGGDNGEAGGGRHRAPDTPNPRRSLGVVKRTVMGALALVAPGGALAASAPSTPSVDAARTSDPASTLRLDETGHASRGGYYGRHLTFADEPDPGPDTSPTPDYHQARGEPVEHAPLICPHGTLHPELRRVTQAALDTLRDLGVGVRIETCSRSAQDQWWSFEHGFSQVTPPYSAHNYKEALAVDIVPVSGTEKDVKIIVKVMKETAKKLHVDINCGDDWRGFQDSAHFQLQGDPKKGESGWTSYVLGPDGKIRQSEIYRA